MKLTVKTPNITQFDLVFERGDEYYTGCMWATINLDHDNYTLTATSDCGNYSYGWAPTPNRESFAQLMSRISGDYLLDKISKQTEFDLKKSKEGTIETLREVWHCISSNFINETLADVEHEINQICDVGAEGFLREVMNINEWFDFENVTVYEDYPVWAQRFCEIFIKFIQPVLRGKEQ